LAKPEQENVGQENAQEESKMLKAIDQVAHKAKPEGNPDPAMPHTPDVIVEGWSAEEIAEESAYLDGTEVKEEMEEGRWVKRENRAGHIFSPPSFDHREV
jgi:hypothetical protein